MYFHRAMSQLVRRPPLSREARVPPQVRPRETCGVQIGNGIGFVPRVRQLFPVSILF